MSSYEFSIKVKPFSINAATYSDARTKTREYIEWASQVFHQLNNEKDLETFKQIREEFDETKHSFAVEMTAFYPKSVFVNKEGTLSSRTVDLSNWEKIIQDLLFDKQYYSKPHPYGVCNISCNDKHVVDLYSKKRPHDFDYYLIEVKVSVVDKPF
jgi:hypothetical protein